jgi:hypothetical protein
MTATKARHEDRKHRKIGKKEKEHARNKKSKKESRGATTQNRSSPMPLGMPLYHKTPKMNNSQPIRN